MKVSEYQAHGKRRGACSRNQTRTRYLGTTTRTDGTVQVTYNGWPLYYYVKDKAPGDVTGQDVGGVWYVVSAAGEQVNSP